MNFNFKEAWNNKMSYSELEEPIQNMLSSKLLQGILALVASILVQFLPMIKGMNLNIRLVIIAMALIYDGLCARYWYIFTVGFDKLLIATGTFTESNLKEDPDTAYQEKAQKKKTQKISVIVNGKKIIVTLPKHDFTMRKGDIVRIYSMPNDVKQNDNGVITVSPALIVYTIESASSNDFDE